MWSWTPGRRPGRTGGARAGTPTASARRDELIDAAVRSIKRHGAERRHGPDRGRRHTPASRSSTATSPTRPTCTARSPSAWSARSSPRCAPSRDARRRRSELIRDSVDAYLALLEQSPELYRFVVRHPHLDGRHDDFSDVIADLLGRAARDVPARRRARPRLRRTRGARPSSASSARPACGGSTTRRR